MSKDLYLINSLTGEVTGPVTGELGIHEGGTVYHNIYLPGSPFGELEGPFTGTIETEPSPLLGAIVLILLAIFITIYLPFKAISFTLTSIKAFRYRIKHVARKFFILALVFWALTGLDLYITARVTGLLNPYYEQRYKRIEQNFVADVNSNLHLEYKIPNCNLHNTECFSQNIQVRVTNNTSHELRVIPAYDAAAQVDPASIWDPRIMESGDSSEISVILKPEVYGMIVNNTLPPNYQITVTLYLQDDFDAFRTKIYKYMTLEIMLIH